MNIIAFILCLHVVFCSFPDVDPIPILLIEVKSPIPHSQCHAYMHLYVKYCNLVRMTKQSNSLVTSKYYLHNKQFDFMRYIIHRITIFFMSK